MAILISKRFFEANPPRKCEGFGEWLARVEQDACNEFGKPCTDWHWETRPEVYFVETAVDDLRRLRRRIEDRLRKGTTREILHVADVLGMFGNIEGKRL